MELRHLRYFVTVAEEMHFGRAAKRLNMAQPPLSKQIQQLERELDVLLFHRIKRRIELTDAGKVLVEKANQILSQVDKACQLTRQVYRGEAGQLIIGFTGSTMYNLQPILQSYRAKFPSVDVVLRRLGTSDQVQALHEGLIHVGLLITPIESKLLNVLPIMKQRFVAALPKSHPLATKTTPLQVQELENESFIMTPRRAGPVYYDTMVSICQQAGFVPQITLEAHELETIVSFISAGMGVSLIPRLFQTLQVEGVLYKELQDVDTTLETSIAWRTDETTHTVDIFVNLIKNSIYRVC